MVTLYDVSASKLIPRLAKELEGKVQPPEWAPYVKTGVNKERPPDDPNWWYSRNASILRYIAINGPVGVQRLRAKYGGRKHRGSKPERVKKGSGNIIRKSLQQLEAAGLIQKVTKNKRPLGRGITPAGQKLLDAVAKEAWTS